MNHHPFPRPGAADRRPGAGRRGRPCVRRPRRYRSRTVRAALMLLNAAAVTAALVAVPTVAWAAEPAAVVLAVESIQQVANNIRTWLIGILVAVATLFLTVGGLRYLAANGDPGEVEKAKLALRSAAIGYALALLAPLFVTIVGAWVA
ncbi:pilin [Micromonospora sp. WMMD1120]|uniref:pilin n=1 Tax=Micromonospora sp. WMMD1120 TaxID=3016106 RepID=UPI0024159DA6|nr:pilin [Micromonospora sp. WMMD1120]MDG4807605.1 pilin [Micromonospora sp. WMMD1120]